MKLSLLFSLLMMAPLAACSADAEEPSGSSAAAATETNEDDGFVGCRPSPGECRYSCPWGVAFRFSTEDPRCPGDFGDPFLDRGACFCTDGHFQPPPSD